MQQELLQKELDAFAYALPHYSRARYLAKLVADPKAIEAREKGWTHLWSYENVLKIAKHFYELGRQARKENDDL